MIALSLATAMSSIPAAGAFPIAPQMSRTSDVQKLSSKTSAAKIARTVPVAPSPIANFRADVTAIVIAIIAIDTDTIGTAITGMATIATDTATTTTMTLALSSVDLRPARS